MRLLFLAALYSSTLASETGIAWTEENCTAAGGTIVDGDGRVQSSCPDKACDWYTNNERKPWCTVKKEASCPLWTNGAYATDADVGKCTKNSWCMAKLGAVTKAAACELKTGGASDACKDLAEGACADAAGTGGEDCAWVAEEKDADKDQGTCDALKVADAWDETNCGTDTDNCAWVEGGDWEYMHADDANVDCAGDNDEFTAGPVHIGGGYFEGCMHDATDPSDGHSGGPHADLDDACQCMDSWDQMGYYEEDGSHQCHGMVGCPATACDGHDTPWCPIKNPFACDDVGGGDSESRHFIWGYCHDDHVPLPDGCQCEETWMDYACDQGCLIDGTTTWHQTVQQTTAGDGEDGEDAAEEEKAVHENPLGDAALDLIHKELCPDLWKEGEDDPTEDAIGDCVSEFGIFNTDNSINEDKWKALDADKKKAILDKIEADHPELHESLGKVKADEETPEETTSSAAIIATGVAAIGLLL